MLQVIQRRSGKSIHLCGLKEHRNEDENEDNIEFWRAKKAAPHTRQNSFARL